jgi:hypothetical protein
LKEAMQMPYSIERCEELRHEKATLQARLREADVSADDTRDIQIRIAAIQIELRSNCGPKFGSVDLTPSFPYTIVGYTVEPTRDRQEGDGVPIFAVRRDEMENRRRVFDEVADAALAAERFYSFARGGMPLMDYVALRLSQRLQVPLTSSEISSRLLMLPSYKWREASDGRHPRDVLLHQLEADAHLARVVLADMSFTGDTVESIRDKLIEFGQSGHSLPAEITLYGILDPTRIHNTFSNSSHEIQIGEARTHLSVVYHDTARLLTEDELELLGYRRLRDEATLQAFFSSGSLIIYDLNGGVWGAASKTVATLFANTLLGLDAILEGSGDLSRLTAEGLVRHFTGEVRRNAAVVRSNAARRLVAEFNEGNMTIPEFLDRLNGIRRPPERQ